MLADRHSSGRHRLRRLFIVTIALLVMLSVYVVRSRDEQRPPSESTSNNTFVYASEEAGATSYWLTDAGRPTVRTLLQTVPRAPGWLGAAALSPRGQFLAYTRLPQGQTNPDSGAELWWLSLAEHRPVRLAESLDLRSKLVWSSDTASVTFERVAQGQEQLWRQGTAGGAAELLIAPPAGTVVIPVAYVSAAALLAARYDESGTDLVWIGAPGEIVASRHLSDRTARGITFSAHKNELGLLAPDETAPQFTMRAAVFDLTTGVRRELPESWGEIVGLAWQPNGFLSAGSTAAKREEQDDSGDVLAPARTSGFMQPLAWSPTGRFLAARLFSGDSAATPGVSSEVIVGPQGKPNPIATGAKVEFVAWVDSSSVGGNG